MLKSLGAQKQGARFAKKQKGCISVKLKHVILGMFNDHKNQFAAAELQMAEQIRQQIKKTITRGEWQQSKKIKQGEGGEAAGRLNNRWN